MLHYPHNKHTRSLKEEYGMWNEKRSLLLSKACVIWAAACLVVVLVTGPWLAAWVAKNAVSLTPGAAGYLMATLYIGAVPAAALLVFLYRLLHNIGIGKVFLAQNVALLRVISWCCFTGAVLCAVSMLYYLTWGLVGLAAAFVGLIVRVVKNVFEKDIFLQEENDLTV